MEDYKKIQIILDQHAKRLVGILCKRVEVLEKEGVLTPSLYKSLIKENIYEESRILKQIVELHLKIGTVVFTKPRDKKEL